MSVETLVAETWIAERIQAAQAAALAADPGYTVLRVHNEVGPQVDTRKDPPPGEPPYYPCVMIRLRTPLADSRGNAGTTLMTNLVYLVEVMGRAGSFSAIAPTVGLINAALHQQRGDAAGGRVKSCIRRAPWKLPDQDGGVRYQRLGYEYELQVEI